MLLYKYRTLDDLWLSLDIILNNRVWCAKWGSLNDPLEGRFHSDFGNDFDENVNSKRDEWRICSLSSALDNFLVWSHYASGHQGIAIELDIPEDNVDLSKVHYRPFSPVLTERSEGIRDLKKLFEIKTEEWSYEREYRIIIKSEFYKLPNPIKKVYLGHKICSKRQNILRSILPPHVEIVQMKLDSYQGKVIVDQRTFE